MQCSGALNLSIAECGCCFVGGSKCNDEQTQQAVDDTIRNVQTPLPEALDTAPKNICTLLHGVPSYEVAVSIANNNFDHLSADTSSGRIIQIPTVRHLIYLVRKNFW